MRRRRTVFRGAVVAFLAALLPVALSCACGGAATGGAATGASSPGTDQTPRQGGTLTYPLTLDPGTFDPCVAQTDQGTAVLHQVCEGLVRWEVQPDGTLKTVPCLAESWGANADATVWTFDLRHGVMFQAPVSREVTSADVVACLRYVTDPAHGSELGYLYVPIAGTDENGRADAGMLGVKALDRYTVRITLKYPYSEFADTLGNPAFFVFPLDRLRAVGLKAYARHPVGTGPYRFERREARKSIDLVRRPEWWDSSGGPYVDTIHYEVFSSVTTMMLAFQKGTVDWTYVPEGQAAASQSLPQVTSGAWMAATTSSLAIRYLCFNMTDPVVGGTRGVKLRRALACACDRQAVSEASSGGVFLPASGLLPPGVPGSGDVPDPYGYEPAKARELLRGLGPVTLRLAWPIGQQQEGTIEVLTEDLAEIGVTVKTRGLPMDDYIEYILAGKGQAYLAGWVADYPTPDSFLYPLFESGESPYSNGTGYANADVDALLTEARATPDGAPRRQWYAEAQRLIFSDAPMIPLIVFADARLSSSRVADLRFSSLGWADLWKAWVR